MSSCFPEIWVSVSASSFMDTAFPLEMLKTSPAELSF